MNAAQRFALALPAVFLLLSLDRLVPDLAPPTSAWPVSDYARAAADLPPRNEGRFGRPGDPLNLIFIGSPKAVRAALTGEGWTEVPTAARASLAAGLRELIDGKPLAAFPPMNDYHLRGRRQDMNWALPVRPLAERHHFRLWRTGLVDGLGRDLWWGSGNYDLDIRWHDLSHVPDPDASKERDFIVSGLTASPGLESRALVLVPGIPLQGFNDKGYPFRTDGKAALIVLSSGTR